MPSALPYRSFPYSNPSACCAPISLTFDLHDNEARSVGRVGKTICMSYLWAGAQVRAAFGLEEFSFRFPSNRTRPRRRSKTFWLSNNRKLQHRRFRQVCEIEQLVRSIEAEARHQREATLFHT